MISCRGKPLTAETKKLVVTVKQYFERNKFKASEPSVKRTADALGIGVATVKRIIVVLRRLPQKHVKKLSQKLERLKISSGWKIWRQRRRN